MMLTNVSNEYKHVGKGMTAAHIEDVLEASNSFALTNSVKSTAMTKTLQPPFGNNPSLPTRKQKQLKNLLLK